MGMIVKIKVKIDLPDLDEVKMDRARVIAAAAAKAVLRMRRRGLAHGENLRGVPAEAAKGAQDEMAAQARRGRLRLG